MKQHFDFHPEWIPRKWLKKLPWTSSNLLDKHLSPSDFVLDLGCGPKSPLHAYDVLYSVGVEIFKPYIKEAKRLHTHDEFIQADIRQIQFKPASFDTVVAFHVLEHLDKDDGYRLMVKMKEWARKKVIISLPNGYISFGSKDSNEFQIHRSGYTANELKGLGFYVYGGGLKLPWFHGRTGVMFQALTYPTGIITYYYPRVAKDITAIFSHTY